MSEKQSDIVAVYRGVRVPASPFLTEPRITRLNEGRYEAEEVAGALEVVRAGDRVLELGAGLGAVGAAIALNARPAALLSFEANPDLIPHIRALHRANGLEGVIELRNQVLVSAPNRPGTVTFHRRSSFLGSSLLAPEGKPVRPVEVATADFAEVVAAFRPDVLVMDIEGGELELLRHADLAGLHAVVLEFHPRVYGKDGMQSCKAVLRRAGFRKCEGVSSRLVWTCTRRGRTGPAAARAADTPPDPEGGWSHEIRTLKGAIVRAPGGSEKFSPAGVMRADGSDMPEAAVWIGNRRSTRPFRRPERVAEEISGTWLWGGTLWNYFAHFIVESSGRLWGLDRLRPQPDGILYIPRRHSREDGLAAFQKGFYAALGITLPIRVVRDSARVERLIVPGQGFGLGAISAGTAPFRAWIHANFGKGIAPDGPERLYISRSLMGAGRGRLIGEDRIGTDLTREGYEVFHPQKHAIATQIARYKAAKRVVAAEGSALHLFAFVGRPDQAVAVIPRRRSRATAHLLSQLTSFTGTAPTVLKVLREVWQPVHSRRKRLAAGEPDLPLLQAGLRAAGFIGDGPQWAPLDNEAVRAALGKGYRPTGETLLPD